MLQQLLTDALSLLTVAGTAAFAVAFVHEYAAWKPRKAFRVAEIVEDVEQAAAAIVQAVQEEIASDYHPKLSYAHKTIAPEAVTTISDEELEEIERHNYEHDLQILNRDDLRSLCQERGIRWSHVKPTANGGKRHLSVAEMRASLLALFDEGYR